jgi:hypothetical protein
LPFLIIIIWAAITSGGVSLFRGIIKHF